MILALHGVISNSVAVPYPPTTNIAYTDVGYDYVDLTWDDVSYGEFWRWELYASGALQNTGTVSEPFMTITGLWSETSYDIQIRRERVTIPENVGEWGYGNFFTTAFEGGGPTYDIPAVTEVSNSPGVLQFSWDEILSGVSDSEYRWELYFNSTLAQNGSTASSSAFQTISHSNYGESYEFRVWCYVSGVDYSFSSVSGNAVPE